MQLTADDRILIMDLLARYARCLDSGDLDGYVSLFTADATLFGAHVGHQNIRTYVEQVMRRRADDPARRMHFVGMPTIDGDAEHASVHSYLLWVQSGAASPISAAAEYTDSCVKQAGRWLFASRTLTRLAGSN
ncbi:MAG: nuclear transport factor 2 family protein [Chloroflexi bacterium]|nr:nuclear transport factor 2 family protein [Chloroflexota bacterium]MBV9595279.1 nuclear transport factor 2 family protein [Chloroflexota bacterium]